MYSQPSAFATWIFDQAGDAERATSWFKKMRAAGFEPDLQVWRWAIGDAPVDMSEVSRWICDFWLEMSCFWGLLILGHTICKGKANKLIVFCPCVFSLGESTWGSVAVFRLLWLADSWCLHALLEKSGLQHSVECSCKSRRHQCSRWGGLVTVKAGVWRKVGNAGNGNQNLRGEFTKI